MDSYGATWAIVLAGGDGSRLRALTTTLAGVAIPKQYCSLWGGPSLLEDALVRAAAIAPLRRICTVVAASHRRWWSTTLGQQPGDSIIVQPRNCGTGMGILLALLHVLERDPYANVVLLPTDHYLTDEASMATSLQEIADMALVDSDSIYLLGAKPRRPEAGLGYILPADRRRNQPAGVKCFVEKPSLADAVTLIAQGALVNAFIIAGSVGVLLQAYQRSYAKEVVRLSAALRPNGDLARLSDVYKHLPVVDFSQDILSTQTEMLKVISLASCGWTDLGTPDRIAEVLKTPPRVRSNPRPRTSPFACLDLATRLVNQE